MSLTILKNMSHMKSKETRVLSFFFITGFKTVLCIIHVQSHFAISVRRRPTAPFQHVGQRARFDARMFALCTPGENTYHEQYETKQLISFEQLKRLPVALRSSAPVAHWDKSVFSFRNIVFRHFVAAEY